MSGGKNQEVETILDEVEGVARLVGEGGETLRAVEGETLLEALTVLMSLAVLVRETILPDLIGEDEAQAYGESDGCKYDAVGVVEDGWQLWIWMETS